MENLDIELKYVHAKAAIPIVMQAVALMPDQPHSAGQSALMTTVTTAPHARYTSCPSIPRRSDTASLVE